MPVTRVDEDPEELTLALTAEYPAPVARVWRVWSDPRLLESWWGSAQRPVTFDRYEFTAGGECRYHLTWPDGAVDRGWWRICAIDEPRRLEFEDGPADADGNPDIAVDATHTKVTFESDGELTRMALLSTFASVEQQEQHVAMGVVEGVTASLDRIDALLGT
ncbi:SRPBCC family protein [Saccharopolyspora griseoalba]|uniref:SRPBCC domain-containing protein n=1 Tax=Saccharopolyspora griseoalba TaxID=1431848 RepID=A0ABW2LG79_9PSEU